MMKKSLTAYYFLLPAGLIMALLVFYPLLYGFYLSFTNMSLKTFTNPQFIWFSNYIALTKDELLLPTFLRTIIWTFVNVFFHVFFGLILALALNRKIFLHSFFKICLIIPWAMPQYIAILTWKDMFNDTFGFINLSLNSLSLEAVPWLSNPTLTFIAAIITNIWLGIPFMMMVILSALKSIEREIYEVAEIDGISKFTQLTKITLPLIKPILTPSIILGVIWTFNNLNVILLLTGGFSGEQSQILISRVYRLAFNFYRYGFAASYSVLIFFILLIFGLCLLKYTRAVKEEY